MLKMASSLRKGQIPIYCQMCKVGERIQCKCLDCNLLMCSKCKEKVHSKLSKAEDHWIADITDLDKITSFLRTGQTPISCQLCEVGESIQCKCLDCNLLMCSKCKEKVHSKFKKAEDHRIVDYKDMGRLEGDSDDLDFTDIKCEDHPKQTCCLYCKTCNQLVCPNCIAKCHNGHNFLDIKKGYEYQIERFKNVKKKAEKKSDLNDFHRVKMKLDQIESSEHFKYTKARGEILSQKTKIEIEVEKLLKNLDKEWNTIHQSIEAEKGKVDERQKQLKERLRYADSILGHTDIGKLFRDLGGCSKFLEEDISPVNIKVNSMSKFIPSVIREATVGKFQPCDTISVGTRQKEAIIKFVKKISTDLTYIHTIATSSEGSLWLRDDVSDILMTVSIKGSKAKVRSSDKICVYDMALNSSGDLLVCDLKSRIKIISAKSRKLSDSFYDVPGLFVMCLHVNKENKIFIGARSEKQAFPVKGRHVVIVMDQNGQQEALYEFDRNNKKLFSYPRIITTVSSNIIIGDRTGEDGAGRIVTLGEDSDVINIYNGHQEVNKEEPFRPVGLITIPSQCVIVTDVGTHTLHILNNEGKLITYYELYNSLGIKRPYSLSLSPSGNLYIGCSNTKGSASDVKAPIYEVEFFLENES